MKKCIQNLTFNLKQLIKEQPWLYWTHYITIVYKILVIGILDTFLGLCSCDLLSVWEEYTHTNTHTHAHSDLVGFGLVWGGQTHHHHIQFGEVLQDKEPSLSKL